VSPLSGSSSGEYDSITVGVDTSGLGVGSYSCDVGISSNGGSGVFTVFLNVVEQVEELDQSQSQYNSNFALYGSRFGGQSFTPVLDVLTRVELYLRRVGSPSGDLVVSVRSVIDGSDLASVSLSPGSVSGVMSWVDFDFDDVSVTPGNVYYIVVGSSGGNSANCYYWGYGSGTPYVDGALWYSNNGGGSWSEFSQYDFCFRSYGI
jgi:hypothetical protein